MPLYDYRCTECSRVVEVMHGIYESGPATCEHCGGAMRKALSAPAIHFKGKGWAKKDAASASAKRAKPKSDSESSSNSSSGDAGDKSKSGTAEAAKGDAGSSSASEKSKAASTTGSTTD